MSRKPQSTSQSSLELLQLLPPEILDRILYVYCDGKALSTFAVALSTSRNDVYRYITYHVVPAISKRLLLNIIDKIESNKSDGFDYAGAIRWIRLIAADNDNDFGPNNYDRHDLCSSNKSNNDITSTTGRDTTIARTQVQQTRRKIMRHCSENLAVVDFLRRSMMESPRGKWEWPVWVGQISVSVIVDATVARSMTQIVILAPFDFPSYIPGSSLFYRHRTPTSLFYCEPMHMLPVPPWGRLRGLTSNDEVALKRIALRLEEAGESHVVVPTRNQGHDPLNIRILREKDARLRIRNTTPLFRSYLSETLTWLFRDNNMDMIEGENISSNMEVENPFELVCFWENDTIDEILPREYIEYIIMLMKTRDRLVRESKHSLQSMHSTYTNHPPHR